jgi:hypothetical protein
MNRRRQRDQAEQIARDLFTNGQGERAERLVLTVDGPPAKNLGGWSEAAVIERIEQMLERTVRANAGKGTLVRFVDA